MYRWNVLHCIYKNMLKMTHAYYMHNKEIRKKQRGIQQKDGTSKITMQKKLARRIQIRKRWWCQYCSFLLSNAYAKTARIWPGKISKFRTKLITSTELGKNNTARYTCHGIGNTNYKSNQQSYKIVPDIYKPTFIPQLTVNT